MLAVASSKLFIDSELLELDAQCLKWSSSTLYKSDFVGTVLSVQRL